MGFAYAAMPTLIMRAVPRTKTAAANGLNAVMRTLGSTLASAVVGVILAANLDASGVPTSDAFRVIFGLGCVVVLIGGVAAFLIPRHDAFNDRAALASSVPL